MEENNGIWTWYRGQGFEHVAIPARPHGLESFLKG